MRFSYFLATACLLASVQSSHAQYTPGSLVGYWPLNETNPSEVNVVDVSGNGNHGTRRQGATVTNTYPETTIAGPAINGSGPTINSVTKNSVSLDGGNDIMRVLSSTELAFNKQKGTISIWLKIPDLNRRAILRSGSITATGIAIEQTGTTGGGGNRIFFHPNAAQGYFMCTAIPTVNTWEHYVFTWDYTAADSGVAANPNRVQGYVNGVAQSNYTTAGASGDTAFTTTPTTTDWVWGMRYQDPFAATDTRRIFSGSMAEIAIYDTNLDATAAGALYTAGVDTGNPNLIAYYDFSEGSGSQVADDAGTNNDILSLCEFVPTYATTGGATWTAANATNKPTYITQALQFDGINDCVVIPKTTSLAFDKNQGTLAFWLYCNSATGRAAYVSDSLGRFSSEASSSAPLYFQPAGSTSLYQGGARTFPGWMHVAYVWDTTQPPGTLAAPNRRKMYFNGVLQTNASPGVDDSLYTTGPVTDNWTVGRRGALDDTVNPRWFSGQMADLAMFSTPLPAGDINTIVNVGVANFVSSVADWQLLDD